MRTRGAPARVASLPPFASMTERRDAANVDVDTLRRVDVNVAEQHEDVDCSLRVVHLRLAQIEVDVSEGGDGKGPSP